MSSELTYADQVSISRRLRKIAKMIDAELSKAAGGKHVLFSLYVWGPGRTQYVSNAERQSVKDGMRETLERWEDDDGPVHQAN